MTTIGVFAGVFDVEGRALCVRHGYGALEWGMPGGRLEPGEDPVSAVEREIVEEAGVVATISDFVGAYSAPYRDDLVLLFVGAVHERNPWSPTEEISEFGFFPLNALPEPMSANSRFRFTDIEAGARGVMRTLSRPGVVMRERSFATAPPYRSWSDL